MFDAENTEYGEMQGNVIAEQLKLGKLVFICFSIPHVNIQCCCTSNNKSFVNWWNLSRLNLLFQFILIYLISSMKQMKGVLFQWFHFHKLWNKIHWGTG